MQIKKYLVFIILFTLVLLPNDVFAKTKEEALAELDMLAVENNDGSCTWDVTIIDPEIMSETYCDFSNADIYEMFPYSKNYEKDEFDSYKNNIINECQKNTIISVIENASRKKGLNNWTINLFNLEYETFDQNNIELSVLYNPEPNNPYYYESATKTCKIEYADYDENELKETKKVIKKLTNNNKIYSLNSFNSIYHYGPIFQNNKIDSDMILYKFPEFKSILMENPEYDFEIAWQGGGGTPIETGCSGYIIAYKNGIPYGMKLVNFTIDNRLYVDKDKEGTLIERATSRLNEFFKNSIKIEFNLDVMEEDLVIDGMVGLYTEIKLGDYIAPIFIIEVDKKELDKFEAKAHHKKYDINVKTNSYDVPLDMTLNIEDVAGLLELDKEKHNILSAYDINLVKPGDGSFINKIEDGIEVYIPISNKKTNDKVNVHHIVDNKEISETLEGEVVELNGKIYVKFITTHFSTYAIEDTLDENVNSEEITSPNTGDNIINSLIYIIISLCGLGLAYKLKNKN